jgi:hypothetical protein
MEELNVLGMEIKLKRIDLNPTELFCGYTAN